MTKGRIKKGCEINTDSFNGRSKEKEGPPKRWIDEVEEDLTVMRVRNGHSVARDRKECWRIVLEAKVHKRM